METYPEMDAIIVDLISDSEFLHVRYTAARIEELERQLADATLTVHVHEKSLDEYAQTAYRLKKELNKCAQAVYELRAALAAILDEAEADCDRDIIVTESRSAITQYWYMGRK